MYTNKSIEIEIEIEINFLWENHFKGRNFCGNLILRMAEKMFFAEFNFANEKFG